MLTHVILVLVEALEQPVDGGVIFLFGYRVILLLSLPLHPAEHSRGKEYRHATPHAVMVAGLRSEFAFSYLFRLCRFRSRNAQARMAYGTDVNLQKFSLHFVL